MPCTLAEAHDQILALLPAQVTALAVHYPDVAPTAGFPPKAAPWARVSISDDSSGAASIGSSIGNQRYESSGLLTVELYTMSGDGRAAAQALGQAVLTAYRGKRTSPGGVWFFDETVSDVGPDGVWRHTNVRVSYRYDTIQ